MRKINYSKVMIIGIILYIFFQIIINIIGKSVKTEALESKNYEFSINKDGLIIKNETVISSDYTGVIDLLVSNNEKVKKGEIIARVYKNNNIKNLNIDLDKLNNDIKKLEQELKKDISYASKELINTKIKLKEDELENITKKFSEYDEIFSPISGRISFTYNEKDKNITKLKSIEDINIDYIKNFSDKKYNVEFKNSRVNEGDILGRVIDTSEIYIAFLLDDKEAKLFENNKSVFLKKDNLKIGGEVYDIKKYEKENILIVKINSENEEILNENFKNFDIIYNELECIKIKKSSTKIVDNKLGVFIVDFESSMPKFVEIKGIEYQDDEYMYINYYKNKKDNLKSVKIYDELILNPNIINTKIKIE